MLLIVIREYVAVWRKNVGGTRWRNSQRDILEHGANKKFV